VGRRGDAVIRTESLTKSYGRARGIVDLSLEVERGEVFGFLGPNGAGKTTTIRTILDFIRPTAGRATVLGLDSVRDSVEIHRRTGYLPGELALWERMTGRELLEYLGSLRGGLDRAAVDRLDERLDVDLDRRIGDLSHGNRTKLGLIVAFAHRPDVVILDEPTQGLDPLVQQEFYRLVEETRDDGRTVFLSSHVLPEVERVCDRVGAIREGRLAAVERVADLAARAVRHVTIRFAGPVPLDAFRALDGVSAVRVDGDALRLTAGGPIDALVKTAARFEVRDLVSEKPNLEELFLALYGRQEPAEAPAEATGGG